MEIIAKRALDRQRLRARDQRWNWLGHILRMDKRRTVRQVLLQCFKPTAESLWWCSGPKTSTRLLKIAKNRIEWKNLRPSKRCWPHNGGMQNTIQYNTIQYRPNVSQTNGDQTSDNYNDYAGQAMARCPKSHAKARIDERLGGTTPILL